MLVPVVLLLAAVGLLIVALGAGHAALAWGSVGLSVLAAVMILRRWRRSWLQRRDAPEDDLALTDDEIIEDAEAGAGSVTPVSVAAPQLAAEGRSVAEQPAQAQPVPRQPGEEDTDAADLLVIYELTDEVLVVDEHPRYHLDRCRWPDHERAERLPVREARELGFTPCARCRPDKALARKHRAGQSAATGAAEPRKTG